MSDDLVRRQDAIDVINRYSYYDDFDILVLEHDNAVRGLSNLPSAQVCQNGVYVNICRYCEFDTKEKN